MMNEPFWDKTYKDLSVSTFDIEPNPSVLQFYPYLKPFTNVLDVGCGEGRSALFLADKKFTVDAFDISEAGILKLKKIAEYYKLDINAWVQDLCEFEFDYNYELIYSHDSFHFVKKSSWKNFIRKAKSYTNPNGLHIIQIFTNKIPPSDDIAPFAHGLAEEGELRELYTDWKILESESYEFEDEHPGFEKHYHSVNKIIAQKP